MQTLKVFISNDQNVSIKRDGDDLVLKHRSTLNRFKDIASLRDKDAFANGTVIEFKFLPDIKTTLIKKTMIGGKVDYYAYGYRTPRTQTDFNTWWQLAHQSYSSHPIHTCDLPPVPKKARSSKFAIKSFS